MMPYGILLLIYEGILTPTQKRKSLYNVAARQ